jgi:hypothetical protein
MENERDSADAENQGTAPTLSTEPVQAIVPLTSVSSVIPKPKKVKLKPRGERFRVAAQEVLYRVKNARNAFEEAKSTLSDLEDALLNLRDVRDEYQEWYDNLPENLQDSSVGEKLQIIIDIDLEPDLPDLEDPDFDSAESAAQECLDADLPLGFGRD